MKFDGKDVTDNILTGEDILNDPEFLHWSMPQYAITQLRIHFDHNNIMRMLEQFDLDLKKISTILNFKATDDTYLKI